MVKKGVYYKRYDDAVYVRDTVLQRDYIMSETAEDVLDFYRSTPNGTHDELIEYMCKKYPACEKALLDEDMREFEASLTEAEILTDGLKKTADPEAVSMEITDICTRKHYLYSVSMELTYRCSEKCIHCYVENGRDTSGPEMNFEDHKKMIDRVWELGCMNILFTGGEVCLHKDFIKIVKYAADKGIPVNIYTNGISMTDEQFDSLCEMKVNSVSFSLYGGTAEVHDAVSGVKGSFEKTFKRMMMFKCAGIETYIKTAVIKQNRDDYENLLRLGKRLGVAVLTSLMIIPPAGGAAPADIRLGDTDEYEKMILLQNKYYPAEAQEYVSDINRPICGCGQYMLSINPFGDVFPCISMPVKLGNVLEEDIGDIWNDSDTLKKYSQMRLSMLDKKCSECSYSGSCSICMGEVYKEYGFLRYSEESCMLARANHRVMKRLMENAL